ncbi:hypothetical protein DL771_003797 [Monosporascus sp. 5C6A]|nr:hypothetical protein DL771_003797 [Monosporascus sp. 5C6A]
MTRYNLLAAAPSGTSKSSGEIDNSQPAERSFTPSAMVLQLQDECAIPFRTVVYPIPQDFEAGSTRLDFTHIAVSWRQLPSSNAKEGDREKAAQYLSCTARFYVVGDTVQISDQIRELFASRVGVSDKKWNMISLSLTLHDWWSQPYFALKCLGIATISNDSDETIQFKLQFHWVVWRD